MAFSWLINGGYQPLTKWDDPPSRDEDGWFFQTCKKEVKGGSSFKVGGRNVSPKIWSDPILANF